MTTTAKRSKANGQYTYTNRFERLCMCGRKLGVHNAEAPHAFEDAALDDRDLPECTKFRPAKPAP